MLSFWEKNSFLNYDFIIIGSGILGLSTACCIKEKNKKAKVLVLEEGIFPTGASTKNAGFACFGSLTEILADIKNLGESATFSLVEKRYKGIQKLRQRLGDKNIGYENYGGFELIMNKHMHCLDQLSSINKNLNHVFSEDVFSIRNEKIKEFGFNESQVKAVIFSKFESQIDTGKMMYSFIDYANSLGIRNLTGCEAASYSEKENYVKVFIKGNDAGNKIELSAKKLFICTNAFTNKILPDINIKPGRGQVLITKPVENLKFKGVFHIDEGFYYFRNFENRVLFGGGRNLDFETEESTEFAVNEKILSDLKKKLSEIILPGQNFEIDLSWTGIMGFSKNRLPVVNNISDRVACVMSCNGMGVALSSEIADEITGK